MRNMTLSFIVVGLWAGICGMQAHGATFKKLTLTDKFYCEGAYAADFNRDGNMDVVSGPYWYAGPDFQKRHEVREPKAFDPKGYSDNFLTFTDDFNSDGWTDILYVPWPGKDSQWYENPKGKEGHWTAHAALKNVGNESQVWTDVDGDGQNDLVYNIDGFFGYGTYDTEKPNEPWTFHPVSTKGSYQRYTHGVGAGDVNGDGRVSIVDALVIATYGVDASIAAPNGGDIALGDVNGDGQINIVDALMVATYGVDPTNADLPTGIGELVEGRNQLPVLVVPAAQKVREGEDLLLHVQVSDPDGDQVALSVAGNPEGSFLAGKTFSWSPAGGQAGEYEIVFTADDGSGGTVSETVAVSVKRGSQLTVALTDSTTMEFVWIEPGTFVMGTTSEQQQTLNDKGLWDKQYKAELPAHEVTISRGFWLGKYEVTQSQWESVMGQGYWSGKWSRYQDEYVRADPIHPAVYISWEDVQSFVHALNETAGDSLYRLPTEAEWEYACRAGSNTLWSSGNDENLMGDYAWYDETAGNVGLLYAQPVGQKLPNSWGLYDMHGNVGEWVQDWYGNYSDSTSVDPQNSAEGSFRVWRGGATVSQNRNVRSARRFGNVQGSSSIVGARLLRIK